MDIMGALTMEDDDVTIIEDVESHSSCSTVPNKRMKLDSHDNQIAICSYFSVTDENYQNKESLLQEQTEGLKREKEQVEELKLEKEQAEELKREKSLLEKKVEDLNEEILKQIKDQKELKKQIKTKNRVIELRGQRIEDINKSLNESQEQSAMKLEKQAEIIERYECEASEKEEMLKEKDTQMKNLNEDLKRLQKELEQTKEQLEEVRSLYSKYFEVEDMKRENPSCGNPHGEIKETYKLSKDQEEMSSLRHDIQRKDMRINILESDIKKIKEAKEKSKEQLLLVLNNQDVLADNYRRQIKQFDQEREKFMKKIKNLTTTVSEQKDVIQNLREEIEISTTAVSRQNNVIKNLREESEKSELYVIPILRDETDTSTSELEKEKESSNDTGAADNIVLSSLQEDNSKTKVSSDADLETVRLRSKRAYLAPPKLTSIPDGTNSAHSTIVISQATDSHPSAITPQSAKLLHSTQATDSPNSTVTSQASSNSKVASSSTDSSNPMVVSQVKDSSNSILASGLTDPSNSTVTSKARNSTRSSVTSFQLMQDWLENLKHHETSPTSAAKRQLFLEKEDTATVKVTSKRKNRVRGKQIGRACGRLRKVPQNSADGCIPHPGVQPLRIQIRTNKTKEHVDKLYQVAPSRQCDNDSSGTGPKAVKKPPKSLKESRASGRNISSPQEDLKSSERRQPIRSCTEKKKVSIIECPSDEDNEQPICSNTKISSKVSSGEGNRPIRSCTERSKVSTFEFSSDEDVIKASEPHRPIRSCRQRKDMCIINLSSDEDNDYNQRCEESLFQDQKTLKQKHTKAIKNKLLNRQKNANVQRKGRTGQFTKMLKSRKSSAHENHSARRLHPNTRLPKKPPQEGLRNAHAEIEMPNRMKSRDSRKTLPPATTSFVEDTTIVTTSTVSADGNECASDTPSDFHLVVAGEKSLCSKNH